MPRPAPVGLPESFTPETLTRLVVEVNNQLDALWETLDALSERVAALEE